MQQNTPEIIKQKNSNLSILLIVVNLILLLIFANVEDNGSNQESINYCYLSFVATVLLGFYAFSYHGKGYRIAKWLFAISLIISLLLFGLMWYGAGLAGAFKN
ncbi:small-conductance mechanosensitive channel [Flavobacterium arsenatis]|uniref:Small-conductance mechanosensitive channel n=1 Tax=Flavobacterium arsenatis TaxID=1484332 RepID=A0ABU1TUY4_9FLAO|nr:hypothetical protein [Flavobacterium arsenatis]MDR6969617.1 small-conductance mechanosensitive channel [Flavobacterium arsenatis]